MKIERRKTKVINVGGVKIGGNNPVSIQSMTKTDTKNVSATTRQINELTELGCEIIRVSIPDIESANKLPKIINNISIPLIADIHFNWQLAVKSIDNGASCIRINPGNIGKKKGLLKIIKAAKQNKVSIRIGVNSGSLDKKWIQRYKGVTAEGLVASALEYIKIIEDMGFNKIKISIKAPDIQRTISAYRFLSKKTGYPLHIGVTEAGPLIESAVKSSIALGALLMEGIGDTMRVSVTGKPHSEVIIAKQILQSLGLRRFGPEIISCPTCARCKVDLVKIVNDLQKRLSTIDYRLSTFPLKVAIMGCVVNGPGEAREADIGIAFGKAEAVLFKKGVQIKKISQDKVVETMIEELAK